MFLIRPMQPQDLPQCGKVIADAWDIFTAQLASVDLCQMFGSGAWKPFFYVATEDGEVAGLGGYGVSWLSYGIYDMFWHCVRKESRGRGIGRALIERRLSDLRSVADAVMIATPHPDLYGPKFSFELVTTLKSHKGYGDHLMIRKLT